MHPVTPADFDALAQIFDSFAADARRELDAASMADLPRVGAVVATWTAAAVQVRGFARSRFDPEQAHHGSD